MSEALRITCPCGYENWVPAEKRGQTVPCFICGQDLVAEEIAPQDSMDEVAPPTAVKERPSTSAAPRSPFEADDVETAVRPKFQHAPPTPATAPSPALRPRSPFEAEAPEQERILRADEKLVAGPFSLEAAPVPNEGPGVIDEMEKLRPKERRDRHMIVHTISPHDAPTGEKCAQCGKEMRGSWDRIETEARTICYVCSNQATHDVPLRLLTADTSPKREIRDTEFITASGPAKPEEYAPWWRDTHSEGFKRAILCLALGTLFFSYIVWLTDWGSPSPNTPSNAAAAAAVPHWVNYVIWAWRIAASFVSVFVALYLTLDRNENLPYDRFIPNILYLCAVVALLLGVSIGVWAAWMLLKDIFIAGRIWFMFVGAIFFFIQLGILIKLLDFRTRDFFWLYLVYIPVSEFLVYVIGLFLYWGLYELVT